MADDAAETELTLGKKKVRYQPVDITAPPEGQDFWFPSGLSDRAEVYGTGLVCDLYYYSCTFTLFKRRLSGQFVTVAESFSGSDVNGKGDVGGCIVTDSVAFFGQAAIVDANGKLEVIPRLPDEVSSCVSMISESGLVIATSFTAAYEQTTYVWDKGRRTIFTAPGSIADVNDRGQIAGIIATDPAANRAYRFDTRTATTTILEPVAPDPHSWGQAINRHGEVLGYSFIFNAIERIGKWDRRDRFQVSFIEGTPEFPTISNRLIWNEAGLIVISATDDGETYLVPAPGVRLNLDDLVDGAPVAGNLVAQQINKPGDFLANSGADGSIVLLLRR
jgi:uncharacterized membrane protein